MRGGALPFLAWGGFLVVLLALNWIWTGDALQVAQFGFAAVVVLGAGLGLALACRQALRPGPPEPLGAPDLEAIPQASTGAVMAGLAVASILFGLAWATFLVYFGAGLLMIALGRVAVELRAERRARRMLGRRDP